MLSRSNVQPTIMTPLKLVNAMVTFWRFCPCWLDLRETSGLTFLPLPFGAQRTDDRGMPTHALLGVSLGPILRFCAQLGPALQANGNPMNQRVECRGLTRNCTLQTPFII